MRKKLICILLVICLVLGIAACDGDNGGDGEQTMLSTPANLRVIEYGDSGTVQWDAVANAEKYIVTINGSSAELDVTYCVIQPLTIDYEISVVASGNGFKNSEAATIKFTKNEVSVAVSGGSECRSGKTLQLEAIVFGTSNQDVTWEITSGNGFADISEEGLITAKTVSGDKLITVKATSVVDTSKSATKTITIVSKPDLADEMFADFDVEKLSYSGNIEVETWHIASMQLVGLATLKVESAMDDDHWFGVYDDVNGIAHYCYIENRDGNANKVSVNFNNEETVTPILDTDGNNVAWATSDYRNKLKDLTTEDFTFNEEAWRWEYTGSGSDTAAQRKAKIKSILASVGNFDFEPESLYLVVEEDLIVGLHAESEYDYITYNGYSVGMSLNVVLNVGDAVDVPICAEYETQDYHQELQSAIDNMQSLTSYTTEVLDSMTSNNGTTYNGFIETITQDVCYMRPFVFTPNSTSNIAIGNGTYSFASTDFGYIKCSDSLYNSFNLNDGIYAIERAFEGAFEEEAPPSFAFAAEIFTEVKENADGSKTYYVDAPMQTVATTLYHGIGNAMSIYGISANSTFDASAYLPYVTVKDGYITSAGFTYYMGSFYGEMKIAYRDFEGAELPAAIKAQLDEFRETQRTVPASFNDIKIMIADEDNREVKVLDYLKEILGDDKAADVPYFGAVLGDTYNSGITDYRSIRVDGQRVSVDVALLFYEVPFDIDYTIDTSLAKVVELLTVNGFTASSDGVYVKGNISIQPINSQMRLFIYIWNNSPTLNN